MNMMSVPNCENAFVPFEKVSHYLLDLTLPHGKTKAMFFRGIGYSLTSPELLINDLERLACVGNLLSTQTTIEGKKYVVVVPLLAPNGKTYSIKTIWITEHTIDRPRLITTYPN
jgi:hypothetical protein